MPSSTMPVVLVVEDEPILLMDAMDMVEEAGFDVVAAADADSAFAILHERSDIRIVFTDIDMPGAMNGIRLAAAVRDRWPPIDILVTSGHYNPAPGELPTRGCFVPKPYRPEQIAAMLHRFVH